MMTNERRYERREFNWGNDKLPEDYVPSIELRLEVAGMIQRTLNGFWESKIVKYITGCEKDVKRIDYNYINLMINHYTGIERNVLFLALDNKLAIEFDGFIKKGMASGLPRRFKVTITDEKDKKLELITTRMQDFYGKTVGMMYKQDAVCFKTVKEVFREEDMRVGNLYEVLFEEEASRRVVYELEYINYINNNFSYTFKSIHTNNRIHMDAEQLRIRVRRLLP